MDGERIEREREREREREKISEDNKLLSGIYGLTHFYSSKTSLYFNTVSQSYF